jgi:hypothetical protein
MASVFRHRKLADVKSLLEQNQIKTLHRAKPVQSKIEGTPRAQRKTGSSQESPKNQKYWFLGVPGAWPLFLYPIDYFLLMRLGESARVFVV